MIFKLIVCFLFPWCLLLLYIGIHQVFFSLVFFYIFFEKDYKNLGGLFKRDLRNKGMNKQEWIFQKG